MKCPECGCETRMVDSVNVSNNETFRKRKCVSCDHIFYTAEFEVEHNQAFKDEWTKYHRKSK